jgi:hypothetical protein
MVLSFFRLRLIGLCSLWLLLVSASAAWADASLLDAPPPCWQYAEFRQEKILEGLPRPLVSRGRILLDCHSGTLWNTRTPIQETLVYTFGGKHWLIKGDGDAQPIKNAAQKRIGDILARIVRGDREFVDQYFQREVQGQITHLLPTQKRLKKYIDRITLDESATGVTVSVARTDQQNMKIEIYALRDLLQLDAQSCAQLLEGDAGCAQLFPAER